MEKAGQAYDLFPVHHFPILLPGMYLAFRILKKFKEGSENLAQQNFLTLILGITL